MEIEDPRRDVAGLDGETTIGREARGLFVGQLNRDHLLGFDFNGGFGITDKGRIVNSDDEFHGVKERILEINGRRLSARDLEGSFWLGCGTIPRQ